MGFRPHVSGIVIETAIAMRLKLRQDNTRTIRAAGVTRGLILKRNPPLTNEYIPVAFKQRCHKVLMK